MTNRRIRGVIDTLATSVVLVLGRFTPERKAVLQAVANALRGKGSSPSYLTSNDPAVAKGRQKLRWSKGLRARLGMGDAKTDDEIVDDATHDGGVADLDKEESTLLLYVPELGRWCARLRSGMAPRVRAGCCGKR
jgi:hypothetical protein